MANKKEYIKKKFESLTEIGKMHDSVFDECEFNHIDFQNLDFSASRFIDCTFLGCNLSLIKLEGVRLQNVAFSECKILGVNFSQADNFMMKLSFKQCFIKNSYFIDAKLPKTNFIECEIIDSEFTSVDLTASDFSESKFNQTIFSKCNLSDCDFRTAKSYSIDPTTNEVTGAKFSMPQVLGLLDYFDILIE